MPKTIAAASPEPAASNVATISLSSLESRFALPDWQQLGAALWPFWEQNGETPV